MTCRRATGPDYHRACRRFDDSPNVQLTHLAVNGNLESTTPEAIVTAVSGFPALIVTGDVQNRAATSTTTINGSVICSGMLDSQLNASVSVTLNGTCFFDSGMDAARNTCTYLFNWDPNRSVFWDIQNVPPAPQPMTVLNWKEN
jgi:hypothetical protein